VSNRGWDRVGVGAPKGAFVPSGVFLGCAAICATGGIMAWNDYGSAQFDVFLFVVFGWIVSLSLHEYSHAIFAYRGGDRTVAARGYLKLNPLKYAHPVLSIVLPVAFLLLGGIGLPGGAVWVDHSALRSKNAQSLVSLVGPAMNFVLAVLLCIPFMLGVDFGQHLVFWAGLAFLAFLQLTAAILNLIPLPGLDGGNAIRPWLHPPMSGYYDQFAGFGMILVFVLLYLPVFNSVFFDSVNSLFELLGAPRGLSDLGHLLFEFWHPLDLTQG
jgi:Zn-dependent protease